jgi:hypothetical protein
MCIVRYLCFHLQSQCVGFYRILNLISPNQTARSADRIVCYTAMFRSWNLVCCDSNSYILFTSLQFFFFLFDEGTVGTIFHSSNLNTLFVSEAEDV